MTKLVKRTPGRPPKSRTSNPKNHYQIDKIIDFKLIEGHRYYLIKWKNYSSEHNTW